MSSWLLVLVWVLNLCMCSYLGGYDCWFPEAPPWWSSGIDYPRDHKHTSNKIWQSTPCLLMIQLYMHLHITKIPYTIKLINLFCTKEFSDNVTNVTKVIIFYLVPKQHSILQQNYIIDRVLINSQVMRFLVTPIYCNMKWADLKYCS